MLAERDRIGGYLADVGIAATLFCVVSLAVGYLAPRLVRVDHARSVASAFEVGVHNSTLAIAVAVGVLGSSAPAVRRPSTAW